MSWSLPAFLLVSTTLVAAPVPRDAAAEIWAGKTVFGKRPPLQPVFRSATGATTPARGRVYISYRVLADEGDWLRIVHNGQFAWLRKADVVRAEDAIEHFTKLIETEPKIASWPLYRGSAYREIGKYDEGLRDYDGLIARNPSVYTYWNNRASIKISARQYASAIADLERAAALAPTAAIVYRNRGNAKFQNKDYDAAIQDLDKSIDLEPTAAASFMYRGQCREKLGDFAAAGADFEAALQAEPLNPAALAAQAWFLATVPDYKLRDGPKARKLAEQACELFDWKTGSYLDTLAAASAACGHFDDAVFHAEAALRDRKFAADKGDEARARLALYQQKKPYRQVKKSAGKEPGK